MTPRNQLRPLQLSLELLSQLKVRHSRLQAEAQTRQLLSLRRLALHLSLRLHLLLLRVAQSV
jgi:hypothetical protein